MFDIYVGSDSDPVDAIDDITPSAYEEANGSGSGTYTSNDIGDKAGQMGIGFKYNLPILGALNYKYYPKADGLLRTQTTQVHLTQNGSTGSAYSASLKTNMGDLPFVGSFLDGATLTTGLQKKIIQQLQTDDAFDVTAALNWFIGNFSLGVQKKVHNEGEKVLQQMLLLMQYGTKIHNRYCLCCKR